MSPGHIIITCGCAQRSVRATSYRNDRHQKLTCFSAYCFEELSDDSFKRSEQLFQKMPTRVYGIQWVVVHIAVTVVALRIAHTINSGIGLQEPAQLRVIDTPVHVDDAHLIQHLMAGEAAAGHRLIGRTAQSIADAGVMKVLAGNRRLRHQ